MLIIKWISLILVFITTFFIGILISIKYKKRVEELKEIKNALNIFETKIKYTYEPIPEIFNQISKISTNNISNIFKDSKEHMKNLNAGTAWNKALDESSTYLIKDDIEVLRGLGKLLGKTDLQGQVSEIELTSNFLDLQIEKAEKEQDKNERMYKTLGAIVGLVFVIVLI